MDPFSIIALASTIVPTIGKWFGAGEKVEEVASSVKNIAKAISGKGDTQEALEAIKASPEMALQFQTQWMNYEVSIQGELTERHKADMQSDDSLAKKVRPLSLIGVTLTFIGASLAQGLNIDTETVKFAFTMPEYVYTGLYEVTMTVFGFYFTGRSLEKVGALSGLLKRK